MLQQQTMSPSPSSSRKTPKRSSSGAKSNDENKKRALSRSIASTPSGFHAQENFETSVLAAMSPSKAARKGLMCEMDMNAGAGSILSSSTPLQVATSSSEIGELASIMGSPVTANKPKHCRPKVILWKEPIDDNEDDPLESVRTTSASEAAPESATASPSPVKKSFNPKKKWLREAWHEDLGARPLDGCTDHPLYKNPSQGDMNNWQMASSSNESGSNSSDLTSNPNQNRPSVLIMGPNTKDKATF